MTDDHGPFDITIDSEVLTVTAVTSATPQTITVTREARA